MITFNTGLERTRILSNLLLVILLAGNLYFTVQKIAEINMSTSQVEDQTTTRIQTARFLKMFVDVVLTDKGTISFEQRVKLENDVIALDDPMITAAWNKFVKSATPKEAQVNAIKLMSMLANKMI